MLALGLAVVGGKKPKEKPAASVQVEEVVPKESVTLAQETPGPAVRKRKRRPLKAGMETVTSVNSRKVRNISPLRVTKGHHSTFSVQK